MAGELLLTSPLEECAFIRPRELAAMQAATTAGRNPTAAENDQTRARLQSVRRLSAGDAEARSALQRCRKAAPRLG